MGWSVTGSCSPGFGSIYRPNLHVSVDFRNVPSGSGDDPEFLNQESIFSSSLRLPGSEICNALPRGLGPEPKTRENRHGVQKNFVLIKMSRTSCRFYFCSNRTISWFCRTFSDPQLFLSILCRRFWFWFCRRGAVGRKCFLPAVEDVEVLFSGSVLNRFLLQVRLELFISRADCGNQAGAGRGSDPAQTAPVQSVVSEPGSAVWTGSLPSEAGSGCWNRFTARFYLPLTAGAVHTQRPASPHMEPIPEPPVKTDPAGFKPGRTGTQQNQQVLMFWRGPCWCLQVDLVRNQNFGLGLWICRTYLDRILRQNRSGSGSGRAESGHLDITI